MSHVKICQSQMYEISKYTVNIWSIFSLLSRKHISTYDAKKYSKLISMFVRLRIALQEDCKIIR